MHRGLLHLLFFACSSSLLLAASATPPGKLVSYVSPDKLFALSKPADWIVRPSAGDGRFSITVASADHMSQTNMLWLRASKPDLLHFISTCRSVLAQTYPNITFTKVYVSRNNSRGAVTVSYQMAGIKSQGRAYFEVSASGATMQEYAAPEQQLDTQRPVLLNVMASVSFIKPPQGNSATQAPALQIALVDRQAADGSWKLKMPADWQFKGVKGRVLAGQPGGGMGFIFTAFTGEPSLTQATLAQGIIGARYMQPAQTLQYILKGFGHHNIVIKSSTPDQKTMRDCKATVRGGCDAADIVAHWTSAGGANCAGGFKVVDNHPGAMGVWSTSISGIWGPQKDFAQYFPTLQKIGDSFTINDQFARSYVATGLENLHRLEIGTANAIQGLRYQSQDMQRAWENREARKDYMNSKWDDYRRGNSYWVSDLEGGKVYHTDTWGTQDAVTGDYYEGKGYNWTNFEGKNPNYPSEDMHEISSYELEHGGVPR